MKIIEVIKRKNDSFQVKYCIDGSDEVKDDFLSLSGRKQFLESAKSGSFAEDHPEVYEEMNFCYQAALDFGKTIEPKQSVKKTKSKKPEEADTIQEDEKTND